MSAITCNHQLRIHDLNDFDSKADFVPWADFVFLAKVKLPNVWCMHICTSLLACVR